MSFVDNDVSAQDIARSVWALGADATAVYAVLGGRRPGSANRPFFAMWSDERLDLPALCAGLSAESRVCIAWKSEHGGVAGYLAYAHGEEVASESDSGDGYLLLPSRGVERTLGVDLGLSDEERVGFPDSLLDENVACFQLVRSGAGAVRMPPNTVTKLLEDELDVEPVLPVDTW